MNGARDGFRGSRILAREALERLQSTLVPLFVLGNVQFQLHWLKPNLMFQTILCWCCIVWQIVFMEGISLAYIWRSLVWWKMGYCDNCGDDGKILSHREHFAMIVLLPGNYLHRSESIKIFTFSFLALCDTLWSFALALHVGDGNIVIIAAWIVFRHSGLHYAVAHWLVLCIVNCFTSNFSSETANAYSRRITNYKL